MNITVISPGKIKERWLREGIQEYEKRLSRYCTVEVVEVQDSSESLPLHVALRQEGERILQKIGDQDFLILLDLQGERFDSPAFSRFLSESFSAGGSRIVFVIGGSQGVSPDVKKRADRSVCFSPMTFTHQMTRLLLLEQCYRGFRIARGEPYHK